MNRRIQELLNQYQANREADLANTKAICDLVGIALPEVEPARKIEIRGRQMVEAVHVLRELNDASTLVDVELYAAVSLLANQ